MKFSISLCQGITQILLVITAASVLTGLFPPYATSAQPEETTKPGAPNSAKPKAAFAPHATEQLSPEEIKLRERWQKSMSQVPLPKKGCFESSYPSKEWKEVPCTKAPAYPMPPRRGGPRPQVVGSGNDISAQAPIGFISTATGSFANVTDVTSVVSPIANSGPPFPNAYTLQLNTDYFNSTACAGSPNPGCQGWQQFVFLNIGASSGSLFSNLPFGGLDPVLVHWFHGHLLLQEQQCRCGTQPANHEPRSAKSDRHS